MIKKWTKWCLVGLALASSAAVVAPVVVSCSCSSNDTPSTPPTPPKKTIYYLKDNTKLLLNNVLSTGTSTSNLTPVDTTNTNYRFETLTDNTIFLTIAKDVSNFRIDLNQLSISLIITPNLPSNYKIEWLVKNAGTGATFTINNNIIEGNYTNPNNDAVLILRVMNDKNELNNEVNVKFFINQQKSDNSLPTPPSTKPTEDPNKPVTPPSSGGSDNTTSDGTNSGGTNNPGNGGGSTTPTPPSGGSNSGSGNNNGSNNNPTINIPPNDLSPNLPKTEQEMYSPNYSKSNISDTLSFKQSRYDIRSFPKYSYGNYCLDVYSFSENFDCFVLNNNSIIFNNYTNINGQYLEKYTEFQFVSNFNPSTPEIDVIIHLMNNKRITATFYGFDDASINKNADILLDGITSCLIYYLKDINNIYKKINNNESLDSINDYYKIPSFNYISFYLNSIKLQKPISNATQNDYIQALKQYWGYDKFSDIKTFLSHILLSSSNSSFLSNNNYFVVGHEYGPDRTLIVDKNFIKNLTLNDFEFCSLVNNQDNAYGIPRNYPTLHFKFKNYTSNYIDWNIPVTDNSYTNVSDQELLNYLNQYLNSLMINQQSGSLVINQSLNKKMLLNDNWWIELSYLTNSLGDTNESLDRILYDIFHENLLNSKYTLQSNHSINDFHFSINGNSNLVIRLNNASVTTNIKVNYETYDVNISTDVNEFANYLNLLFKNKTIDINEKEMLNFTNYYELDDYLEGLIFDHSSNVYINGLFNKFMIDKHKIKYSKWVYYYSISIIYDEILKKNIKISNCISLSSSRNIYLAYDSSKNKVYFYLYSDGLPSGQIYYIDSLEVRLLK